MNTKTFFVLTFLLLSVFIHPVEGGVQLYLSYNVELDKNLLILKWGDGVDKDDKDDKYYVFVNEEESRWELINEDGVAGYQYELDLKENNNKSFVVCKKPELPKLDNDIVVFSISDDSFAGVLRELKGSKNIESNKVYVSIDMSKLRKGNSIGSSSMKNSGENNKEVNNKSNGKTNESYFVEDGKVITEEEKAEIEREKKKESDKIVNIRNEIDKLNEIEIKDIKGLFKVDSNKETKISYMGLDLTIPEKSVGEDSYIYIMALTDERLLKANEYTRNITCSNEGDVKGYNVTLLRKKEVKAGEEDKNNFIIEGLNNPIDISMKFSEGKEDAVIMMFYYSMVYGRWENVVRIKDADINDRSITASSKELGQFYVGLFK